MNTTNLFVELLVIGAGAALAVLFAVALFVEPATLGAWLLGLDVPVLLALLPLVYVLGIVVDRAADKLFENLLAPGLDAKVWTQCYEDEQKEDTPDEPRQDYYHRRRNLLREDSSMFEKLEYTRSRMRICRGWTPSAFVLALLFVGLALRSWRQSEDLAFALSLAAAPFFLLLAWACWYFARDLQRTYIRKVHRQGGWLDRQAPRPGRRPRKADPMQ